MRLRSVFKMRMSILNTATTEQMGYGSISFFRLFPNELNSKMCYSWSEFDKGWMKVMKAVLQVVSHATVRVEGEVAGQIDKGLLVFLGVAEEDEQTDLDKIVKKVTELRIFKDDAGKTNLSLQDVGGGLLVVSQFTLLADCKKGRRPSFVKAGNPQKAEEMYEEFIRVCKEKVSKVEHGVFGANMKVELLNDGPFTIVLDSKEL